MWKEQGCVCAYVCHLLWMSKHCLLLLLLFSLLCTDVCSSHSVFIALIEHRVFFYLKWIRFCTASHHQYYSDFSLNYLFVVVVVVWSYYAYATQKNIDTHTEHAHFVVYIEIYCTLQMSRTVMAVGQRHERTNLSSMIYVAMDRIHS